MGKARKYIVKKQFEGLPKRDDFEIVEIDLPSLQNGEFLIKTEWVSVDPCQCVLNKLFTAPYEQAGFQVGIVEDSKDPAYPIGTRIVAFSEFCDYYISSEEKLKVDNIFNFKSHKLPDLKGLSPSMGLGAVGMTGATAYFGLLEICKPKAGETVVVTGAAGAVGSIAGQIAKIKGCKVIGFAGSDRKVEYLEQELGFDKAFNYKTVDVNKALKEAAPNGVDCYFDNVGGEISSIIISNMNSFGRVSVCGSISSYNDKITLDSPTTSIPQLYVIMKQLKLEGFIVTHYMDRWLDAFGELVKWISTGQIKVSEHVTEGFDNIYDALVGMLNGENTGKAVVKI